MQRLLPDPGETTVVEQLGRFEPAAQAGADRPHTFSTFALTLDGRSTIGGRAGPIGSRADLEMLVGLRTLADAVMIGAGTMRTERYGRIVGDPEARARRDDLGLPHDPLAVLISGSLELPWDAGLFTAGSGRVLIFTTSADEPPPTATPVEVVRHTDRVDLPTALHSLRVDHGVGGLLCEGGPALHAELLGAGLLDELFVTHAPRLAGDEGLGLFSGLAQEVVDLELSWLLREGSELFARYRVSR